MRCLRCGLAAGRSFYGAALLPGSRCLAVQATAPLQKPKKKSTAPAQRRMKASHLPPPPQPLVTPATSSARCGAPHPSPARSASPPPRRGYAASSDAVSEQLASLKRELVEVRLQLAAAHSANAALHHGILARLAETSRAADVTATGLRYTGMALRAAHDSLEVELRRLLAIGLTADAVDAAAIEAGARQYVRQNIGYHALHVSEHPASVTDPVRASEHRERPPALTSINASGSAPDRSP